jgi:hypothetical protein
MGTRDVVENCDTNRSSPTEIEEEIEFDVEILPNGQIRFGRYDIEINKELYQFLAQFVTNPEELKEFFDSAKNIVLLIGDETLCG